MKRSPLTLLVPTALVLALAFAPAAGAQGTKVTCKDGTTSTATGRGACSGHGGVAPAAATKAATKAAAKADKAEDKAAAKSDKAADKTASKAEKAADKAAAKADKGTAKTAAKSEKAADKASAKADKAADKAATKSTTVAAAGEVTAKCKDGTTSKAKNRRGACSGHGGVESWLKP